MPKKNKLSKIEEEIKITEKRAQIAKRKGMQATYGNYMLNISILKDQLQKLRTSPDRKGF